MPSFFLSFSSLDQSLHFVRPRVAWRTSAHPPREAAPSPTNPPKHSSDLDTHSHPRVPSPRALWMCGHFHCRGPNTHHPRLAARIRGHGQGDEWDVERDPLTQAGGGKVDISAGVASRALLWRSGGVSPLFIPPVLHVSLRMK